MPELVGDAGALVWVVLKAVLLYGTAIIAFRVAKRRALAEMAPFDFVAAVAVGAIVGRVPNADTSYLAGALTLVAVLTVHAAVTRLRAFPVIERIVDPAPRLLVADGRLQRRALRDSGLSEADLWSVLRQRDVRDLEEVRFVVFEQRGQVSVVRRGGEGTGEPEFVQDLLDRTAER